ncbi:hypothetical protein MNEG_14187 [Monoraphidium neglectum]|uniref:EF-hand domain-containing protein n=1 Tax=Monoraphidium neglectum TaxID=145388 RepID=A0A0D2LPV3_9CHLO|nr:hypothetical protein MNEG_14187 [Monoraphidium neglectum]KIY93774.1 hypothetical protein MNEG_14187 [Monoraphidium neglectum]|eukprot:XP_013892794.1 hypothetical protein MNEG_14187 [Monoraphidium neglectum]
MAASDLDGRGRIAYDEFIAAMMDSSRVMSRKGAARRSFQELDRDGDGVISVEDLAQVLQEAPAGCGARVKGRACSFDMAALIVSEVDAGRKGGLSFEDFERVWCTA